jgi:hypothetical protein
MLRNGIVCATGLLLLIGTGALGQEASPSNTRTASCIVKITVDSAIMPLTLETVESLIMGSAVAGKASRNVLGVDMGSSDVGVSVFVERLAQDLRTDEEFQARMPVTSRSDYGAAYGQVGSTPTATAPPEITQPAQPIIPEPQPGQSIRTSRSATLATGDRSASRIARSISGSVTGDRYGDYPVYGSTIARTARGWGASASQEITLDLNVRLSDNVKPAAEEFLAAIVENLRATLLHGAYASYRNELANLVHLAQNEHAIAAQELAELLGTPSVVQRGGFEQLDETVDLSTLTTDMPFNDAIGVLRNSAEPPLKIVVMWRDLLENADIEPSTPIDMDGLPSVRLGTALELLLQAVSGTGSDVVCEIKADVIVVKTAAPQKEKAITAGPVAEADLQDLAQQRRDLTRDIQNIEMELASMQARRNAIEKQIARTHTELRHKQEGDEITEELAKIVQTNEGLLGQLELQVRAGQMPESGLAKAKEAVMKAKIELARRQEDLAWKAAGGQLNQYTQELSEMAVNTAETQARLVWLHKQLEETQVQLDQASRFDPKAAQIRVAQGALAVAEDRVMELNRRLADLEPPVVTLIGVH